LSHDGQKIPSRFVKPAWSKRLAKASPPEELLATAELGAGAFGLAAVGLAAVAGDLLVVGALLAGALLLGALCVVGTPLGTAAPAAGALFAGDPGEVPAAGTRMAFWQLGHLTALPAKESGAFKIWPHSQLTRTGILVRLTIPVRKLQKYCRCNLCIRTMPPFCNRRVA